MNLTTKRLNLKAISLTDLENIHNLHSLSQTNEFNTLGVPDSIDATKQLILQWIDAAQMFPRMKYVFCIESNQNGFIGVAGINIGKPGYKNAEIWYKLHPANWNKGYATEAVSAMLKFCFEELKLHRVEAGCAVENSASIKVLEKIGMTKEGRSRELLPIHGKWLDNFTFAILESDYLRLKVSE